MFDNDPLIACYVTPEDPIIKYYTQQMQQKVLKGETAAVTNDPKEAVRMLMGYIRRHTLAGWYTAEHRVCLLNLMTFNLWCKACVYHVKW